MDKKGDPAEISNGKENIFVNLNDFTKDLAGAKSNNTKRVFGNLPEWVNYPDSFAIPFNVMEYFLMLPENTPVLRKVETEISKIKTSDAQKIASHLSLCRNYILELKFVENEITEKLKAKILSFGINKNVK